MNNYINGKLVTKEEIKKQYYIENYKKEFILIFITKGLYKFRLEIIGAISLIFAITVAFGIANADETIVEKPSGALCQNLAFTDSERFKIECNVEKVLEVVTEVKNGSYESVETQKTTIKWNNRDYNVQVWGDRVSTMKNLGYSDTRILDLLAIMNMECGSYKGNCFNGDDIGPMQINKIHREQYNKSMFLYQMQDWGGLFVYQLDYANKLLDGYDERFCGEHIFKEIGVTYTNKKHFECIGKSYNGHPRFKYAYVQLGWERRSVISDMIFN